MGSYDPDSAWPEGRADESAEAVRCVCGAVEDEGDMVECDFCHYWLHSECLFPQGDVPPDVLQCPLCRENRRPHGDVILSTQPDIRLPSCKYFKALENSKGLQIRLNESVYVRKPASDLVIFT